MAPGATKKRAASPADDDATASPRPRKQPKRGKPNAVAQPISDDEDEEVLPVLKPKRAASKAASKGKGKSKQPHQFGADDDEVLADTSGEAAQSSAQYLKNDNLQIPLDEGCASEVGSQYAVYVDRSDGIIYDASLNQTNAGNNANKFYRIQVVTNGKSYLTWTRWGRVGQSGQKKVLGNGTLENAIKEFGKKFKDKSGLSWADRGGASKANKYVFVERSYEPDSDDHDEDYGDQVVGGAPSISKRSESPAKCTLQPSVRSLMEFIFNQQYIASTMADLHYDAEKLPLGKLSKTTITRGYEALKSLAEILDDPNVAQSKHGMSTTAATDDLSNRYYSYIPHAFGRNRPPVISSHEQLKREVELLSSLTDLKNADSILKGFKKNEGIHPLNLRYNGLGLQEMTPLDRKTNEFINITDYLMGTKGATHALKYTQVVDVFRIQRSGEFERFDDFAKQNNDRRLLWHGSRSTNFGGILSQGLRIAPPEAPASGWMFDKGLYLADMSSKSANYCYHSTSGGEALLLLCEAELGSPMQELVNASYTAGEDAVANGMLSTWGQGMVGPARWKDAECIHPSLKGTKIPDLSIAPGDTNIAGAWLQYNEYICYDVSQVRLRYLLRVKMK